MYLLDVDVFVEIFRIIWERKFIDVYRGAQNPIGTSEEGTAEEPQGLAREIV